MSSPVIVPGGAVTFRLSRASGTDPVPSAARCQLVLDPPATDPTGVRLVKVYDPAGVSSPGVSASGNDVVFALTAAETAAMTSRSGRWEAIASLGMAAAQVVPVPDKWDALLVHCPPLGAIPHG